MTTTEVVDAEVRIWVAPAEARVRATATLEIPGGTTYTAEAKAPRSRRADPEHDVSRDLAIARALRAVEAELMHSVHERIDRFVADE